MSQEHSEAWKEAWDTSYNIVTRIKSVAEVLWQASFNDNADLSAHTVEEISDLIKELSDEALESLEKLEVELRRDVKREQPQESRLSPVELQ